jgi:N-acetyl-anhydromuramyl-L-alanine amidase AmpD
MAAYSLRHYGVSTYALTPKVIVLHFTDGSSWTGARNTFAADTANLGELPGTCAHFVIDQQGIVHALVPVTIQCRHTIGLNNVAIGIEIVQASAGHGSAWADQQILARPAQVGAALALVRQLQAQFGISTSNVIGHAMANSSPLFVDHEGWRNDHTDWLAPDVAVFRSRL